MQINIEVLYKLILSFWVCPTRHTQSTQNKKFAYLRNISRKARGGGGRGAEVDFLPENKHKRFLQVNSITLGLCSQACPWYPSLQYLCKISRKAWRMNLIFCLQIKSKVSSNCYYHFRCAWLGMHRLPKITSLLFLGSILRKNWVMKLIFWRQMSMKACYQLIVWFDGDGQAFQKVPKLQVCNVFTIS